MVTVPYKTPIYSETRDKISKVSRFLQALYVAYYLVVSICLYASISCHEYGWFILHTPYHISMYFIKFSYV